MLNVEFLLCERCGPTQRIRCGEFGKQSQVRFDGGSSVGKAVGDVVGRHLVGSIEKSPESIGTQERIVRTDANETVETECFGSTDEAVEHIVLVAAETVDTSLAGHLLQYVVLRADGCGQYYTPVGAGSSDAVDKNVDDTLSAIEGEQYFVVQTSGSGACLDDNTVFHIFIRLKASM